MEFPTLQAIDTTSEPWVRDVLSWLVSREREVLGGDLVGSYLFGSAATGDFEPGVSDVDTVAVLRADPTAAQLTGLGQMHREIVEEMPEWKDRVEVVYLSTQALATFRTMSSRAARISPGEPFHAIEVDHRWLIDWFQLREVGVVLHGPSVASVVPAISREEYVEAVRQHLLDPSWLDGLETRGDQSYAILTMCRGLRTLRTGEHVSKREAARWASDVLPARVGLIRDALAWRERSHDGPHFDATSTRDVVGRFVVEMQRLARSPAP